MEVITKKIVGYKVLSEANKAIEPTPLAKPLMGEHIEREQVLTGKTYVIKPSTYDHAFYITINSISIGEVSHPFEIFINSKGIGQFRFMAVSRLISAVFRKGGDVRFLVEELSQIHDPIGAYTSKRCYPSGKRKRFNSIEAEIGDIIEEHLESLVGKAKEEILETKKEVKTLKERLGGEKPIGKLCNKCNTLAVVRLDGCDNCTNCGYSKCSYGKVNLLTILN